MTVEAAEPKTRSRSGNSNGTRTGGGNAYLYTGVPSWYHLTIRSPGNMETCGYCGETMPGCYVEPISLERNGKKHELWRCEKCRDDMHQDYEKNKVKNKDKNNPNIDN
jgi:hypothetical protein